MKYKVMKTNPVATFCYKGNHSHPVRRTVVLTETNNDILKGYEVREGTEVRDLKNAPIKSFSKDKIATTKQLRGGSKIKKGTTTLKRMSMAQAEKNGF